jgi:uncharacterized membrane protein (UPF0127 family)
MKSFLQLACAFLVIGCASLTPAPVARAQDINGGVAQSLPTVSIHIGSTTLATEIASTSREGEIGLMYRSRMPDNNGMLFVLPVGVATFWMKNTLIPLSVAFLDKNGVILELHDMRAMDTSITRSDSDQVAYAIETNLHWFDLNGIKPGVKIAPAPAAILKEADAHAAAH